VASDRTSRPWSTGLPLPGSGADLVRVAIPNKGRLRERAIGLLALSGLRPAFVADRSLVASMGEGFQAIFVRAQDIPEYVADGVADAGITGHDLICESGHSLTELLDLEFGACRLVVAVREESSFRSCEDLPERSRVATSFPRLAGNHFSARGISINTVSVSGAAEIAPHLGVADAIVDLTSTGSTLRVHGLRELDTVLASTARLVAGPPERLSGATARSLGELSTALESVVRAKARRYLMANVPRAKLDEVRRVLPGLSGPTIVQLFDSEDWVAAHAVVDQDEVFGTVARLKKLGGQGILVTRIERLMP